MSQFDQVTVIREANVYFEGRVTSRTVLFADGEKKTLGIMLPGEFTFGTGKKEIMEILSGEMDIRLPGSESWLKIVGGQSFEVPANSSFDLVVRSVCDYCCSYLD